MKIGSHGIVSYAGLNKDALLSGAGLPFSKSEIPARYRDWVALFPAELMQNMDYVGKPSDENRFAAPSGFSINPAEYHEKMLAERPELYVGDNRSRNFDYEGTFRGTGVVTVDDAWAEAFPQYRGFLGEKLVLHLIGRGAQAVAVPESVKGRSGYLDRLEELLEITPRVQSFVRYAAACVRSGEPYDADACAEEYLKSTDREPVGFSQQELEVLLQRKAMAGGRRHQDGGETFYLHNARKAEQIRQYVPMRYACDAFTEQAVTPAIARLVQPYFKGREYIGDFWIPYADIQPYLNRPGTALDMRALCESFQIAPAYDPATKGGKYPDSVRVAVIRDRDMKIMTAEALNNPAYGSGLNADGKMGRHVFVENSRRMIRTHRIDVEKLTFRCESEPLSPEEMDLQRKRARAQEVKGRLIDALYRLHMAQSGDAADAAMLQKLGERADKLRAAARTGESGVSGYDADISYLERKLEGLAQQDPLREASIECGYAMRNAFCRVQNVNIEETQAEPVPEYKEQPIVSQTKGDHSMKLTPKDIAKMLDHSTLQPFLTQEDVRNGCEIALKYGTASVCARPADMPLVSELLKGSDVHVSTVIGFPHGNHKPAIKLAEAEAALDDGCVELDMVINIGRLIAGEDDYVQNEIADICALAHSRGAKVKVIIETCYLSDEQKVRVCKLAAAAGADWVKTSTGYGSAGCKLEDVVLMRKSVPADCQVKGSGGIRDLDTVLALRAVGATPLRRIRHRKNHDRSRGPLRQRHAG